nr:reverse transcriptase domain-containing protein [Tanacetum cinerariifolium]
AKAFLADVECTTHYDDSLAITTTIIFEVIHEDGYESDVDEAPHATIEFMANLTGSNSSVSNGETIHMKPKSLASGLYSMTPRRSRVDPTLLKDFIMATNGNGDPPVPDLQTMEELCQRTLNGRGGPIALITIEATNFGLKNDMIQQVQNSCQFHGLSGDDANKHLNKFLHVTQSIKVNGVTDDALHLYLFPHSLTHHATAWFDRLPRNSINKFKQMAKMFLGKYLPLSMMNTASSLGSGTLLSKGITNPKEDLNGITTRSGNAYKGPMMPTTSSLPKVVKRETEVTKNTMPPTNNGSTKDVQPLGHEDVFVKVGTFHFPADFVVVDYDADPRVPLILGRSFLTTELALIDVYEGELTIRIGKEAIIFNFDQTSRYSANYDALSVNRIDLIDVAYEECSQKVLGFSMNGNPTPSTKPIVSNSSLTLTPFGDSDFLLEETDAFLAIDDVPISPKINESYYDSERDILLLEEFLNDDPSSPPLPPQELKIFEPTNEKSSINEPPVVELKDLPPHLEYAFFEGDDKLPVIIAKDLKDEEKTALIMVLKSYKHALTWQLSDIKGINSKFCTHKILMEDDFKLPVQHERRFNPKIHEVIKKEILKLLDVGLIYPIWDSPWVGEPQDQEKTTFTCPYEMFAYRRMPFGLCNAPVFGNSFGTCLSHLDKMLKRCEDPNLCLNWEKSHFMVKEGIILDHKISKNGIEVDKAKVDVIAKHPTTVKGIRSFLGHVGFYRQFIQDFSKISRPMTRFLEKDTPFFFSKECVEAFQKHKKKLTEAPILVAPDWDLPFELMYDASDFSIGAVLG